MSLLPLSPYMDLPDLRTTLHEYHVFGENTLPVLSQRVKEDHGEEMFYAVGLPSAAHGPSVPYNPRKPWFKQGYQSEDKSIEITPFLDRGQNYVIQRYPAWVRQHHGAAEHTNREYRVVTVNGVLEIDTASSYTLRRGAD